jgi:hypothetical protein
MFRWGWGSLSCLSVEELTLIVMELKEPWRLLPVCSCEMWNDAITRAARAPLEMLTLNGSTLRWPPSKRASFNRWHRQVVGSTPPRKPPRAREGFVSGKDMFGSESESEDGASDSSSEWECVSHSHFASPTYTHLTSHLRACVQHGHQ